MSKVSIIIPARGESKVNLMRTIQSIYKNATGDFEVIVGFDGYPEYEFNEFRTRYKNLDIIYFPRVVGIKTNITAMASMAKGKYIYKSDAHCRFGKGFDEILKADMQPDWIVMPRFKIIKDDWSIQHRDGQEEIYDYFYLCCPLTDSRGYRFKAAGHWRERTDERLDTLIDETPQIHGSGWFMERDHYFRLGGFPNIDPHGHGMEPINLALKNWLMGGKVMVNKKTFYAHLHQQGNKRGYHMSREQEVHTYLTTAEHWMGDKEPNLIHGIRWFVNEKFPNMPTWSANWEQLQKEYEKNKTN